MPLVTKEYKLKSQLDTILQLSEWQKQSKKQIGKESIRIWSSHWNIMLFAGGNIKWYNHFGEV